MPIRVLIADDESHCRSELKYLLESCEDISVAGEAANGIEALERCRELSPDIVFLDIQMPGLTGLETAAALEGDEQVIFVTAYDQHAVKAFELGALDYLLKPVDLERLRQCLERAQKRRVAAETEQPADRDRLASLARALPSEGYLQRIVGRKSQRIFVLPVDEIHCFEMEDQLLFAVTERERYWTNYQMKTLEPRLDPQKFVRAHRESIVNINSIRELAPITRERYEITLRNNHKLTVSRNYLPQIKEMLGWA